ncbi:MAG: hypothetical protein O7C98_10510 [Planctomycetota bacterium]|nr:hypothetical protein [Planctomycetota bacterium]
MRFKPRTAVLSFALAAGISASASAGQMEDQFEAKLKKPFMQNASWVMGYDKALEEAKASGKTIFGYFTRSYAP